jgi:hypothetical protein
MSLWLEIDSQFSLNNFSLLWPIDTKLCVTVAYMKTQLEIATQVSVIKVNVTVAKIINEPCHDKTNVMRLQPAWIQTSLRIRAVWSESMLFAYKPCYE